MKDDRDKARAHRYERRLDAKKYLSLSDVVSQVQVFQRYLEDLYVVATGNSYIVHFETFAHAESTAQDLADLIVFGSITDATVTVGLVRAEMTDQR